MGFNRDDKQDDYRILGQTGTVYLTRSATITGETFLGVGHEEARRRLTIALLAAKYDGKTRTGAESWRARSRTTGLDISATVLHEDGLAVVTAISIRYY